MTRFRTGRFCLVSSCLMSLVGCGFAPELPGSSPPSAAPGDPTTTSTPSTPSTTGGGGALVPGTDGDTRAGGITVTETSGAYVLHMPAVGPEHAAALAHDLADLLAAIDDPAWGDGPFSFDPVGVDWTSTVRDALAATGPVSAQRSTTLYLRPMGAAADDLLTRDAALRPDASGASVGVLPIALVDGDAPAADPGGVFLRVQLWTQQTPCAGCPYGDPVRIRYAELPLVSPAEIAQMESTGAWRGGRNWIVAKSGVFWAASVAGPAAVRNWFTIQTGDADAVRIDCLTGSGNWPN